MIGIDIPGFGRLALEHMVLDYNGTLAVDGNLLKSVGECLTDLSKALKIHVVTADTFGKVRLDMKGLPCEVYVLPPKDQAVAKQAFVIRLGADKTVAIGNGRNDRLMLQTSALGIAVILGEGAAVETLQLADVACVDIVAALDLLRNPLRLTATLRS
ncbi:MAG: ATPase P [Desulfobacterales bacterium CG23_combo_of_CG06-09_8_20_14_all_52_9]|nr:MAG: ATPase P [Desulfobacterales bacterium CG23_combo_of_CG06-09_8_20_14_all_52_9]